MAKYALLFVLLFGSAAAGCKTSSGAKAPAAETAATTTPAGDASTAKIVMPGQAAVGDTSMCLVSGETFVVAADSPKSEHEGKTYYFCCPGCDAKFDADPAKYLAEMPTPGAAGMHHDEH